MPVDVTADHIRIRVRDPGDFVEGSFRTVPLSEEQGISSVMGKLKSDPEGSMVIQNYMFLKNKGWDEEKAQKWVDDHKEQKSIRMKPMMDEEEEEFMARCMDDPDMKSKHAGNAGRDNACQMIWDDMGQMDSLNDKTIEKRVFSDMEIRAVEGQPSSLVFYPAVFNSLSEEMWGFREKVMPGAFSKALSMDVRALFNHDPNYVLGRNKANTLTLNEDERGLKAEVIPPDTQWARDLMISVKRGDISQGSFSFKATDEEWDYASIPVQRTIKEAKLYDVSIVTYPAYPQTSIQVRSKIKELRKKPDNEPDPVMQQQRDRETKLKQQFEVLKLRGREIKTRS